MTIVGRAGGGQRANILLTFDDAGNIQSGRNAKQMHRICLCPVSQTLPCTAKSGY